MEYIREVAIQYRGNKRKISRIADPEGVVRYMRKIVYDDSKEHFVSLYLDGRHVPICHNVSSIGTASSSLVHPREIFQPAILVGACAVIVAHNHPSGNPSPSNEDKEVTKRLVEVGKLIGIPVLDSLVWTRDKGFTSFKNTNPDLF